MLMQMLLLLLLLLSAVGSSSLQLQSAQVQAGTGLAAARSSSSSGIQGRSRKRKKSRTSCEAALRHWQSQMQGSGGSRPGLRLQGPCSSRSNSSSQTGRQQSRVVPKGPCRKPSSRKSLQLLVAHLSRSLLVLQMVPVAAMLLEKKPLT
jgi:hypothetical protein